MNLLEQFTTGLAPAKPWDSIVDFVLHKSFLGYEPYPRQLTLLKLIFLETENMTQYDFDVIEEWRDGFGGIESVGVQPDIWKRVTWLKENGYRRFPHIQSVLGRRAGKGWLGGILGAEHISYMISLDNWQKHYGIQAHKDGVLNVVATKESLAIQNQFADIKDAVLACKYLAPYRYEIKDHVMKIQTPADLRYIAQLRARKQKIDSTIATIRATANASTSSGGRGMASFANFFDEMAHLIVGTDGPRSSEEVYKAYQPSLRQFKKDGLTYIPSTPLTKVGAFFKLYTTGSIMLPDYTNGQTEFKEYTVSDFDEDPEETFVQQTADPKMLVIQLPSWEPYKDWQRTKSLGFSYAKEDAFIEYDESMKILEANDQTSFKVEYRGQFAEVEDAYLDPIKVDAIFAPLWDGRVLQARTYGMMNVIYHGHSDPGLTGANFAISIAHLEDAPPDEFGNVWPHAIVDYMKVYRPKDFPDKTVDYDIVLDDMKQLLMKFPSMQVFSYDQWNSAGFISALKKQFSNTMTIKQVTFTKEENFKRAEKFKSAVNLGWIHSFKDDFLDEDLGGGSLLEQELKFLTMKNRAIEKQSFGPVTTKDLADCVMESTTRLLERALDKWKSALMGSVAPTFGEQGLTRTVDRSNLVAGNRTADARRNMSEIAKRGSTNRFGAYTGRTRGR
jgi:hypothetical protein